VAASQAVSDALDLSEDPRFLTVVCDQARSGDAHWVAAGIEALRRRCGLEAGAGVLICPGHMPEVGSEAIVACINMFTERSDLIVVAAYRDRTGRPVVLPLVMAAELGSRPEATLDELIARYPERLYPVQCSHPGVCRGADDHEDGGQPQF
jgi:CTP:molybdopterin cytidylyltransferase MocA